MRNVTNGRVELLLAFRVQNIESFLLEKKPIRNQESDKGEQKIV